MARKKLGLFGAALGMLLLILDSRAAAQAAAEGVDICIRTVIPSLFPFFLLSGYLAGGIGGSRFAAMLFHSPVNCGGIILTGLLGGYPVGAKLAAQQYRTGAISKSDADRLLWFCSQAGPSFLFGILEPQMGEARFVWILWAVQLISAISVAWLLPVEANSFSTEEHALSISLTEAMQSAIRAIASVCGWVIIFSVVIAFLKRWVLWLLPETVQILLCGILELTNGCLMLSSLDDPRLRFILAAVMLNFGGLCVMMQTFSVSDGLKKSSYFLGKLIQTCFCILYSLLIMGKIWAILPVLFAFILKNLHPVRKRSGNPVRIGV